MKLLIAVLVVVLVVGATTAVAQTLIGSAQIRDNSIRSKDVRNRTLTLRDLSPSTVRALRGRRGPRGARGVAGPLGPAGLPGPRGVSEIFYVDGPVVSVPPSSAGTSTASCPAGSSATGGGVGFGTEVQMQPVEFHTVNILGFSVIAFNPDVVARNLQATVACARQ